MARFLQELEELLPVHLHDLLAWEFIPWNHILDHYRDMSGPPLTALFDAYHSLGSHLDLKTLSSRNLPEDTWGCMRCGFCCTSMRPGPVTAAIYQHWEKARAPVALFYKTRARRKKNSVYRCWFHNGIRLRICPLMFINRNDSRAFCSIYHMKDEYRPSVCSCYIPRHETCTSNKPDIQPWESC